MEAWLNLILGGGLVATIGAVFKGLQMFRNSMTVRTRNAVSDLERWRLEADTRTKEARADADWYLDLADYWRARAGMAEFQARSAGVTLDPPPPLPIRQGVNNVTPAPAQETTE